MAFDRVTNQIERVQSDRPSRLRVLSGAGSVEEIRLPNVGVVLGAEGTCDVVVDDGTVSKRHVSIRATPQGFEVQDLGSRNGTWVDGVKIAQAVLPAGAVLRIGRCTVLLLPAESSLEIAPSVASSFGDLQGTSPAMRKLFAVLGRASVSEVPVLLLGESGTGKELAARAIHQQSGRKHGPFVTFDCGAASETLIETELFGHKRGSFTGAHADRVGAFASADGGTLFLDEVGDLPVSMQPKLLRVLERGEVTPLGTHKAEAYDVRIVAATHRDLFRETERGSFRADLYYRLAVIEAFLPPLRAHLEDVPVLVRRFLEHFGSHATDVAGPSLTRLMEYSFPGNVRELRNIVARAVALAAPGAPFADMPILLRGSPADQSDADRSLELPFQHAKELVVQAFERKYLTALLVRSEGNLAQAARLSGLERKHLYRVLERAGCLPERLRKEAVDDG